jgi:crotonobetaine/carnitine-CoA ligase
MLTFPHFEPHFQKASWTLPQVLSHQARTIGDRPFLQWADDTPLSFAETHAQSNRLAHGLRAIGINKGDRVVLFMPNCMEFVLAWFALSKIGAVEAPVNTAYKGEFLEHQVRICGADTMLVAEELLERVEASLSRMPAVKRIVVMTREGRSVDALPRLGACEMHSYNDLYSDDARDPAVLVQPKDLGAILFTSGTTGLSKGVLMPHAQIYFFAEVFAQMMQLSDADTYMTAFPFFHANAQFLSIYPSMIVGARCVMYERFSASEWVSRLNSSGATVTNSIGVTLPFICAQPPSPLDKSHKLRKVYSVPTPYDSLDAIRERFGIEHFFEAYGQTEICHPFQSPADVERPRGAAGLLVDQWYDVRLVNLETDQEVPPGEIGELVIRPKEPWTINVGYANMPEKTLDAYRNLWFHTGDAMRRDAQGWYYFVDRMKDALRRRGENVSSFEVEEPIRSHPDVADVAVVAAPSGIEGGEDEIKACVVLKGGATLAPEKLIAWCEERMPYFAIPRYIEFLGDLPRTPTEKVQKNKLREAGVTAQTWDREKAGYRLQEEIARAQRRQKT